MRQIILDTETTGLEPGQGHRIIEIGCIEMIDRRMTGNTFHQYINPEREIEAAAIEVHGITLDKLSDQPVFRMVADELRDFIKGGELIIHNAPFDVAFLNHEFAAAGYGDNLVEQHCTVQDSLVMARHKHPGQRNSLDALCKRYGVDNSQRELHGALLDAEILADVYLMMTGGQISLLGESEALTGKSLAGQGNGDAKYRDGQVEAIATPLVRATPGELAAHHRWLQLLEEEALDEVVWKRIDPVAD